MIGMKTVQLRKFLYSATASLLLTAAGPGAVNLQAGNSHAAGSCIKGDCQNGYGTFKYKSGDRYVGNFNQGKPHGQGILYCSNGNKYLGDWEHARKQGKGRFVFKEGHEYFGDFHQDKFHGKGVMEFADGDQYDGDWQLSMPDGLGVYTFKNKERYEGGFRRGRFNGQGNFFYRDGSYFSGNWKDGKKHGYGVFHDASGCPSPRQWYEGNSPAEAGLPLVDIPAPPEQSDAEVVEASTSVRIWAVIVGIASYAHIPSLRYTDDDAYVFYSFLKSPEGGALPDQQIQLLVDELATRQNIMEALRKAAARADADDVLLFYFSGHGLPGAFLPVDFDGSRQQLNHLDVKDIMDRSAAKAKLLFSDACHSGTLATIGQEELLSSRAPEGFMLEEYYRALANSRGGMALILSSRGKEVSLEASGLRSGVFSHYLIKGLKGEADTSADGMISVGELFAFVRAKVKSYTAGAQTPVLAGDIDREMPLAVMRH